MGKKRRPKRENALKRAVGSKDLHNTYLYVYTVCWFPSATQTISFQPKKTRKEKDGKGFGGFFFT